MISAGCARLFAMHIGALLRARSYCRQDGHHGDCADGLRKGQHKLPARRSLGFKGNVFSNPHLIRVFGGTSGGERD
jgi:hypothetical protein